ncbi:metallophosphoesterase family protein [Gloeobacter kilaueensis]|nr:metallophosphoesterase [Gloeobacter kilaueensis]
MAHLSDPLLLWPTPKTVRVVWFSEGAGSDHSVRVGHRLERVVPATSRRLSTLGEDGRSHVGSQHGQGELYERICYRPIYRHEAIVRGLDAGEVLPYRVVSHFEGRRTSSDIFALKAAPAAGSALKILLTSDHQLLPMVAANLQKVEQTVGRVDAVFFAGDLVNVPDRVSEWFDDNRGNAFFACLQGRAHYALAGRVYRGGALLQYAPIFPCIGNHEVMGAVADQAAFSLASARPVEAARALGIAEAQLIAHTYNSWSYQTLFGAPPYYALSFGDVRLIALYGTRVWRSPLRDRKGKYSEDPAQLDSPQHWGHGEFIFEPVCAGSLQYEWLKTELLKPEFRRARYRIVMLHHPLHGLGGNIVPPFCDPVADITRDDQGRIKAVRYRYPKAQDQLLNDLKPLLEAHGVQLVLFGHSHLWNRFDSGATHYLETANVGNTFGAYTGGAERENVPDEADYCRAGDPGGLEPVVPTLAPLTDAHGQPLPYLASNTITAFSILETANGTITSYAFDTGHPDGPVVAFDAFAL